MKTKNTKIHINIYKNIPTNKIKKKIKVKTGK